MPTGQYKPIQELSIEERRTTLVMKRVGRRSRGFRLSTVLFTACMTAAATLAVTRFVGLSSPATDAELRSQLENKVQLLSEHIARVRKYEDQLKLRSSALKQVVEEAKQLDHPSASGDALVVSPSSKTRAVGGMGGGESHHSPLYRLGPTPAPVARKLAPRADSGETKNVLDVATARMEEFRHLPVGVPVLGDFTSLFGRRLDPFTNRSQVHEGVDISVDQMSPVVAVADGIIVNAGPKGAYGNAVIISHGDGYETLYGHLSRVSVTEGEKVCRGQQVGFVGSTGHSTGPHVHYEVRYRGTPRNPAPFIRLTNILEPLS